MKLVVSWGTGVGLLASAALAVSQPSSGRRIMKPPDVVSEPAAARDASSSLEAHLAMAVAERLLASDSSDDRVRGVERLVASGQREAVDRVLRTFDAGSIVGRDPRARLAAVRGLSPFLSRDPVRKVFERELAVEPGGVVNAYDGQVVHVSLQTRFQQLHVDKGIITLGPNGTVEVDVPVANVGSPALGQTLEKPSATAYVRVGIAVGSLQTVDSGGPAANYVVAAC